jgi:hypothetical protein
MIQITIPELIRNLALTMSLIAVAGFTHAEEQSYAVTGYEMKTVAGGTTIEEAVLTIDTRLPDDQLLILPFLFQGDTAASVTAQFNDTTLVSFIQDDLTEGYWNYLYIDVEQVAGQQGKLKLTLQSEASPATLLLVSNVREADGWPGYFSGTEPNVELQLALNNISEFNPTDGRIYSCLAIMANNQPTTLDGVAQFDIAFAIVSLAEGIIQVVNSRPFNPTNARTDSGEQPECSGEFETTTNIYTDTVSVSPQTLTVKFELFDGEALKLRLTNAEDLN